MENLLGSVQVDRDPSRDEEVHLGSGRISRSVGQNQVPRANRIISLGGFNLLEAFAKQTSSHLIITFSISITNSAG